MTNLSVIRDTVSRENHAPYMEVMNVGEIGFTI